MGTLTHLTLYVDLSCNEVTKKPMAVEVSRRLIGGAGAGWKLIADYLKPGVDPLSSENVLVISPGVLVGTRCPGASKLSAITKFPVIANKAGKYFIDECTGGGRYFGPMLKMAGYDHLVITGKAPRPVYLRIFDDSTDIVDASHLWGKNSDETADSIISREGIDCGVATIGPAGENKVRYALAFIDKTNSLGRCGLGAVFGSKNLKAIVTRGRKGISPAYAKRFDDLAAMLRASILRWPNRDHWISLGMGAGWSTFVHTQYPGKWPKQEWDELYGEQKRMQTIERVIACRSCLISCRVKWRIRDGEYAGESGLGSPYGKSATSGQLLDVKDHRRMIHLVRLANDYGIDFYTATRLIDFVTTLYQDGKISEHDCRGLELRRDYAQYLDLLDMIVHRKGFGDFLADGWISVEQKLGLDPQDYWYGGICKGVDFIYDARPSNFHPLMMTFFTRPRPHHGGSHTLTNRPGLSLEEIRRQVEDWGVPTEAVERIFAPTSYSGKFNVGVYTKYMEDQMRIKNSLGICSVYTFFDLVPGSLVADLYSSATGFNFTAKELMECGDRISNVAKLLNAREGFSRLDDRPPDVWFRPMDSPEGRIEMMDYFHTKVLTREDVRETLNDYYRERGWDADTGIPTVEQISNLGLRDIGIDPAEFLNSA